MPTNTETYIKESVAVLRLTTTPAGSENSNIRALRLAASESLANEDIRVLVINPPEGNELEQNDSGVLFAFNNDPNLLELR